jgi:hypothetical protein
MAAKFRFDTRFRLDSRAGYAGDPEYVLRCNLAEGEPRPRVIQLWNYKPTQDEVLDRIRFALRCFDLYHSSLSKPDYLAVFHSIEGMEPEPEE